ncbi:MAG TPA: hypothetical protein VIV66_22675 [Pyrinomonadaceae bacterium]
MTAADYADQIRNDLRDHWLPHIYTERILKLRTRAYHFDKLNPRGQIAVQHTLLGVELKAGRQRFLCPDLPTARYLSVFARIGCHDVAIPYDITKISRLADELESSWYRMLLLADYRAANETERSRNRIRRLLINEVLEELKTAGAGPEVPEFKQSTR